MPAQRTAIGPRLLACGLALTLGGCVAAAPLAQMAVTSATTTATQQGQACLASNGCTTAVSNLSLQELAKRFDASAQKWAGADSDTAAPPQPMSPK